MEQEGYEEEFDWGDIVEGTPLVYYYVNRLDRHPREVEKDLTTGNVYVVKNLYVYLPIIVINDDTGRLICAGYDDFISLSEYRNKTIENILK